MSLKTLGDPVETITFKDPDTGVTAYLVLDSLLNGGCAGGGIRMMPNVTLEEIKRLARGMTFKYGITNIPSGGAKMGIVADPKSPHKREILKSIVKMLAPFVRADVYRFGEDLGTTKEDVAFLYQEIGIDPVEMSRDRAKKLGKTLALPPGTKMSDLGGKGFEEKITSHGVYHVFLEACENLRLEPRGLSVAIQGFGTVGGELARLLHQNGIKVPVIADIEGTLEKESGLPIEELLAIRSPLGAVDRSRLPAGIRQSPREAWLGAKVDVLVPAAVADTITESNVSEVKGRLILEAANIPITPAAEAILHQRGITVTPDFSTNAGAAAGYAMIWFGQCAPEQAYDAVAQRLREMTRAIFEVARTTKIPPREAAKIVAIDNQIKNGVSLNLAFKSSG